MIKIPKLKTPSNHFILRIKYKQKLSPSLTIYYFSNKILMENPQVLTYPTNFPFGILKNKAFYSFYSIFLLLSSFF